MSDDVTADLLRALAKAIDEPSLATELRGQVGAWESLAIVLVLGEGYRSASGYAYASDGSVSPGLVANTGTVTQRSGRWPIPPSER